MYIFDDYAQFCIPLYERYVNDIEFNLNNKWSVRNIYGVLNQLADQIIYFIVLLLGLSFACLTFFYVCCISHIIYI